MSNDKNEKGGNNDNSVTIIVNGQPKEVAKERISFEELIVLAFGAPGGSNTIYTITYRRGAPPSQEGILVAGQSVQVKKEMIFNVTPTDKS